MNFAKEIDVIAIDNDVLFKLLKEAIALGSMKSFLSWNDFDFKAINPKLEGNAIRVEALVAQGMPYLDAVFYCNASPDSNRPEITFVDAADLKVIPIVDQVRGIFCWFFSLFTQGRAIAHGNSNFLRTIVPASEDFPKLIKGLSTADIEKFPKTWITLIGFDQLGEESRNRLALGAAGHRYLGMLRYLQPEDYKAGMDDAKRYVEGIRKWTKDQTWWELHSATKSGAIINATKSLNKTIEDCLHYCLTDEAKQKFVGAKLLHSTPVPQPAHATWRSTDFSLYPELKSKIFN